MSEKPIRVLYATHEPNLTGASRSLLDLLSALDRTQIEPLVLLRKHGPIEKKLQEIDVPCVIETYALSVNGPNTKVPDFVKKAVNARAANRISKIIQCENVDIVHSNSLLADVGMCAARKSNVPYVCHVRDLVEEDHNLTFFDKELTMQLMRCAAKCVFISKFVENKFKAWIGDVPREVVYNAVSLGGNLSCESLKPFSKQSIKLFLPGRFALGKGQLDAIKAVEILHNEGMDVALTLAGCVGQEVYYQECKNYVESNSMHYVNIKPFIENISDEYAQADVVLMCSQAEAMGRVTAEGMIAGKLVIGADAGATPELIRDGKDGLLYECGNENDLASKIMWAISHPTDVQDIIGEGRKQACKRHDARIYASEMMGIYADVVA